MPVLTAVNLKEPAIRSMMLAIRATKTELFQVTDIRRDGFDLIFSQAMRDWFHYG